MPTVKLTLQDVHDVLSDQLPLEHRAYANSLAFNEVCRTFLLLTQAPKDERADAKQSLIHAKENFDDFILFEKKRKEGPKLSDSGWGSIKPPEKPYYPPYKESFDEE